MSGSQSGQWTWPEIENVLHAAGELTKSSRSLEQTSPPIQGVQIDSRLVVAGDLFIALAGDPGPRFQTGARSSADGHDYVNAAKANGAVACIVQKATDTDMPCFEVNDTYDALWALGHAAGARLSGPKIAVTGSSGKTTAKNMLHQALGGYASPGSFNNHIGVPLSLVNAPLQSSAAVFEIGTSFPGEIAPLAAMVKPDVAMVLNVGSAHAENFPNRESLLSEKISIFNGLDKLSNSVWEYSLDLEAGLSFGSNTQADVHIKALEGDLAHLSILGSAHQAKVPGGGLHRAATLCGVIACCVLLEVDLAPALNLDDGAVPVGRGNVSKVGALTLVDDSYNANPDSMLHAVNTFLDRPEQHKVLLLGEMLELGGLSAPAHEEIAQRVAGHAVLCVGPAFRAAAEKYDLEWVEQADDELLTRTTAICRGADAVFLKGSNRVFWQSQFAQKLQEVLSQA